MNRHILSILLLALACTALSASAATNKTISVEAFYLPAVGIWEDDDKVELNGTALRANVHTGEGWGIRAGTGAVGLAYLHTRHDVNSADDELESHSVYLDFTNTEPLGMGPISGNIGIGLGGVLFDFSNPNRGSRGGGAIMGRLGLRAYVLEPLYVAAGGGGYLFGYPGETLGYGAFAYLSVGVDL